MKSKRKLNKNEHKPIDNTDDEQVKNVLNSDVVPYVVEDRTKELDEPPVFF